MKSKSFLVLAGAVVLVAGCASLFTFGSRTPDAFDSLDNALAISAGTSAQFRQLQEGLRKLELSHQDLLSENARIASESADLAAAHAQAVRDLDRLSQEVNELCKTVVLNERVTLPSNWHHRMIEANRPIYQEIRAAVAGLDEDQFPTVRTWYGENWKKLTRPFHANEFPTEVQRDELVKLLDGIREGERLRTVALHATPAVNLTEPVTAHDDSLTATCEHLATQLRMLQY
jgi:hypothetical protein